MILAADRPAGKRTPSLDLITLPAVQRELKLNEGQVAKAQQVAQRMNARINHEMGRMKGLKADEQAKRIVSLAGPH